MRLVLACLAATGCLGGSAAPTGPTLPADTYFIYDRVDECLANEPNPWSCAYTVALCSNGRAAQRIGDVIEEGFYEIDGPVATGTMRDTSFELNVETGDATGLALDHYAYDTEQRWNTLQFDTIDCSQR
jgi:hypothetical protein